MSVSLLREVASPALFEGDVRQYSAVFSIGPDEDGAVAGDRGTRSAAESRRRAEFAAGRTCAARALERLQRSGALAPPIPRASNGAPLWPAGVTGSITHTGTFVSAAVARSCAVAGLGIDSEPVIAAHRARDVMRAVAWPVELARAREAGLDRLAALTLVFSAKESVFKCLFARVGRIFGFHDVRIEGVDARTRTFHARIVKTLSSACVAGTSLTGRFVVEDDLVHTGILVRTGDAGGDVEWNPAGDTVRPDVQHLR